MKSIVNTFGGAVTYLRNEFGTFDISSKRTEILQHIKDNPDDKTTVMAWESFLKGTKRKTKIKISDKKPKRNYYIWYATDVETGEVLKGTTCDKLGQQIGRSGNTVSNAYRSGSLLDRRYKVTREPAEKKGTEFQHFIWTAKDQKTGEVISAGTTEELGKKLGVSYAAISQANLKNKLVLSRYKITKTEK